MRLVENGSFICLVLGSVSVLFGDAFTTTKTIATTSPSFLNRNRNNNNNNSALHVALPIEAAAAVEDTATDNVSQQPKVGVLLLNLGGPETGEDVEGFLYNLFADPDIIRLPSLLSPLQSFIALFISKRRAPKSRAAYDSIGGGSPILQYSNEQARLLKLQLLEKSSLMKENVEIYVGMRYWKPFTEEALANIRKDKIDALVILPLYPQFSISTSGSSFRVLQEEFALNAHLYRDMTHTVVPSWYDRPGYIRCMANLIMKELDGFTEDQFTTVGNSERHVLFSAHGVPKSYIDAGDPYQTQIQDCVAKISQLLPEEVHVHLSYQSRVGPIEWLRPYTDDVLPQLGDAGVKNLVVVPVSFVSEHIETLEEIDMEYRELAIESGIVNWRRCPALNTDPAFITDMADMVLEALNEPIQTVTEACVANNCGGELLESKLMMNELKEQKVENAERLNGRVAMAGITGTILMEMMTGRSLLQMFGM